MKNILAVAALALTLLIAPQVRAQGVSKPVISHLYDSVALLYTQNEAGDMRMACSVTAFAVVPPKESTTDLKVTYRFVSAAHCVGGDDDKQQKLAKFYISADTKGTKAYFPARLIEAGDKTQGDDFSLFEVTTADKFTITPLGDSSKLQMGDHVINVAGVLGMGKQYFEGYVSETHLDRPPLDAGEVIWTDVMLIQIGGGPGSSGSTIVSLDQNAIVGFLVGSAGADNGKICVPVDKFKAFIKAVDAGTYKKAKKSDENSRGEETSYSAWSNHGSRGGNHGGRSNGGATRGHQHARDGHFNRDRHGRLDARHSRWVGDHREYFFDGFWFGYAYWPGWVFDGDVYVVLENDGYVMHSYSDPTLSILVNLGQ